MKKTAVPTLSDAEKVKAYMALLEHPLKAEIEAIKEIIQNSNSKINERIKWNAPSYYYKEDLVTFNHRNQKQVHLVFHHPTIVNIQSGLLEGDYKDRRMTYFADMAAVQANKAELEKIMNKLVDLIDGTCK